MTRCAIPQQYARNASGTPKLNRFTVFAGARVVSNPDSGRLLHFSGGHSMTDQALRDKLVERLNLELDIPFIGNELEGELIGWVVDLIAPLISSSILEFIVDASDGLSDAELERFENFAVAALVRMIDIPAVPKLWEPKLYRPVVRSILQFARTGVSL